MAFRFRGQMCRGIAHRMAGAVAALALCGHAVSSTTNAYSTFQGLLHQAPSTAVLAGTFSGAFHYDLTDGIGGPGGGADGLPDHMVTSCTTSPGATWSNCTYTPLAAFSSRYFADFDLSLLDGTQAHVRLSIDRIDVVSDDLGDYLAIQMAGLSLTWEAGQYFDTAQLAGALARLPAMAPPAGAAVTYAGIDYSVYFDDVGPLSIPEPDSMALAALGSLMALGACRRQRPRSGLAD